jgi:cytochrome c oxidase assembly protein subunit 20
MWTAGHWAVGSFLVTSISANEYCRYMRRKEKEGMRQAVEMMEELKRRKRLETEAVEKAAREAARAAEEERRRKSWTNPSNYKFW